MGGRVSEQPDVMLPLSAAPDSRRVLSYLVVENSDDYIAIMDVLEQSVADLTPAEVTAAVTATRPMDAATVDLRLLALKEWGAASARTDTTLIRTRAELLSRNWRYTATPTGRQAQRFFRTVLAGAPVLREIPLASLNRVVESLERLRAEPGLSPAEQAELVGRLFTSHDDLDGALVGAEDALASLADRFDLDDEHTSELKGLLVDYATRVAAELETGASRAFVALEALQARFAGLAECALQSSHARDLIERGALAASRGGREQDWLGLRGWFDPQTGRAARFSMRLVRALPGMHANLRRLHTSSGTATGRSRALAFARACADPTVGPDVWRAALGDHSWRKLYGASDDDDLGRVPSWLAGPVVDVPELLRTGGRTGARGRYPGPRDDRAALDDVRAERERRAAEHDAALREVLGCPDAGGGGVLSLPAAQVALATLMQALRAAPSLSSGPGRRTAAKDGLACTVMHTGAGAAVLRAPTWRVLLPGQAVAFHLPGHRPRVLETVAAVAEPAGPARLVVAHEGVA